MSVVAILGAGEIGSSVAFALARRARVRDVRLVDAAVTVAQGKALDIRQTGPIEGFDTIVSGRGDTLDATNADLIVIADAVDGGEWEGERGLALITRLARAGSKAPVVFAGPNQRWLMEAAVREAGVSADTIVGSATTATHSGLRALVALEVNGAGDDIAAAVVGRGPAFTIGWTSATLGGSLLSAAMPPHRMLAVADTLKKLWPPQPHAIGAATAIVVEGLLFGARRHTYATTVLNGEYGERGIATMLPLELGNRRVQKRIDPSLSGQERVEFLNALR
jgi:malate dehydrogenase